MLQDDEKATAWNFELTLPSAVSARYVLYRITPQRTVCVSELQVLDRIGYEPFDIRIAPPAAFSTPTNLPPSVSLTAPSGGSTFTAPAAIAIAASASDSDGTISRVDFFAGGTAIGSATASPFAITWTAVPAGQYRAHRARNGQRRRGHDIWCSDGHGPEHAGERRRRR